MLAKERVVADGTVTTRFFVQNVDLYTSYTRVTAALEVAAAAPLT